MKKTRYNFDKWLFYNFLAIIIFLPLPLGGNRIWAWSLIEAWIFASMFCWSIAFARGKTLLQSHHKKLWLPFACLIGFALFSIIQITFDSLTENSIPILNKIQWTLLSLDPHAGMQQLLKTLAYICVFIFAASLINTEARIKLTLQTFFISGLFQATYGGFMTLSGIEQIFFIEKFAYIGTATGTFVNRNHFANYLVICIACGTALLLMDLSNTRPKSLKDSLIRLLNFMMSKKMIMRIGLAAIVVGVVLSRSRMGNVSLFISLAIAGIAWMILTKRITRNAMFLLASFIIIDLLVVGNWFGFDKVQDRLQNTSASSETRDEVVRDSLVYIQDHPLTGSGGGSYYSTFPYYRSPDVIDYYSHAHNDYLEILSEYGVIGTSFIVTFVISSLFISLLAMRKRSNPISQATAFASLMTMIALLLHSTVDFNLQIPANAASATILLTLAWIARYLPNKNPILPHGNSDPHRQKQRKRR